MWNVIPFLVKIVTYGAPVYNYIQPFAKVRTSQMLDEKIMKRLNEFDVLFSETIKKSYKNLIIDFGLILIMLIFSFHSKMKGYELLTLLLISFVYIFSLFIIVRRYYLLFRLYKQHKPLIDTYYPIWKSTKAKKFGEKKTEFIELAYEYMYKKEIPGWQSKLHTVGSWFNIIDSKKEILERILDKVKYIFRTSLRKKIIFYLITFVLILVGSYSIKWLLIDINTGFSFVDYIVYPFKQLYFIWFN